MAYQGIAGTDTVDRAWNFVSGWVTQNKNRFSHAHYEPLEIYGMVEGRKICVIAGVLNQVLEEAGYSVRKCIRGFGERGYIRTETDSVGKKRNQIQQRVKGIVTRVYILNLEMNKDDECITPLTGKSAVGIIDN